MPSKGYAYLEEVAIETSSVKMPNFSKHDKTEKFGVVIFASKEEQHLVGKVITIDPWRVTPINLNGRKLFRLDVSSPTLVIGADDELKKK